jgi:hypothetical protein
VPLQFDSASQRRLDSAFFNIYYTFQQRLGDTRYGHYRLNILERRVTRVAEAHYEVVVTNLPPEAREHRLLKAALLQRKHIAMPFRHVFEYRPQPPNQQELDSLFGLLLELNVARADWICYWHEERARLDDFSLYDTAGTNMGPGLHAATLGYWASREGKVREQLRLAGAPDIQDVLWLVSGAVRPSFGFFRLTMADRTITRIGDAAFTVQKRQLPPDAQVTLQL